MFRTITRIFRKIAVSLRQEREGAPKPIPDGPNILNGLPEDSALKPVLVDSNIRNGLPEERVLKPVSYDPKNLNGLPAELLREIADFLPMSSAAALTLSCRYMYIQLGATYLERINEQSLTPFIHWFDTIDKVPEPTPEQQERESFLVLLSQDLHEEIYCYYCKKIHHFEKSVSDLPDLRSLWDRPCTRVESTMRVFHYYHDYFYFSKVQYIMKRHRRFKLDCSLQLKELSTTCYIHKYPHTISTHALIWSGNLFLRSNHWILLQGSGLALELPESYEINICPHIAAGKKTSCGRHLQTLIQCYISHYDANLLCNICTGVHQCKECDTEFQICHTKFGIHDLALGLIVWQDFGDGSSPFDSKWEPHRSASSKLRRSPDFLTGSLKEQFENIPMFVPWFASQLWLVQYGSCQRMHYF